MSRLSPDLASATVAAPAAAVAVAFPAGGAGAAAGAWDTAANRDAAIARFASLLADVDALRTTVASMRTVLRDAGLMK